MHILETARAIEFQTNYVDRFWSFYVEVDVYVLNRISSTVLEDVSPFE